MSRAVTALSVFQLKCTMAAAVVGPAVATGAIAYAIAAVTRLKAFVIAPLCGLVAPISVVVFAWLTPLTKPDPRSIDGPAYVLVALIYWALLLIPTCLLSSSLGVWLRRRLLNRPPTRVRLATHRGPQPSSRSRTTPRPTIRFGPAYSFQQTPGTNLGMPSEMNSTTRSAPSPGESCSPGGISTWPVTNPTSSNL